MKRRVIQRRVVVLLLLLGGGAIVNVAVAWGYVLRWPQLTSIRDFLPDAEECKHVWARYERDGMPNAPTSFYSTKSTDGVTHQIGGGRRTDCLGLTVVALSAFNTSPSGTEGWWVREFRSGIPFLALQGGSIHQHSTGQQDAFGGVLVTVGTIPASPLWPATPDVRLLPLQPIWPGFAINTIFYAAILWVMFAVPLALRRRRRMQRGLCPACAYPIGTSEVCTECGHSLGSKDRQIRR